MEVGAAGFRRGVVIVAGSAEVKDDRADDELLRDKVAEGGDANAFV